MSKTATAPAPTKSQQPQTGVTVPESVIETIENKVRELSLDKLDSMSPMRKTLALANGMRELRAAFDGPVLDQLLALRETKLGFRTDRVPGSEQEQKSGAYSRTQLRDALIEGALRGANFVGNEINVIAGSCYLTKEYFQRRLVELEDLTELQIVEGVPQMMDKGALVPMWATWKWKGKADGLQCEKVKTEQGEKDTRICVRVNSGMGIDAIIGKAHRKLYARIMARVTGAKWAEVEAANEEELADVVDSEAEPAQTTQTEQPAKTNGASGHHTSVNWRAIPGLPDEVGAEYEQAKDEPSLRDAFAWGMKKVAGNDAAEAAVQTAFDARLVEIRSTKKQGELV